MTSHPNALLVALLTITVALAGCTGDDADADGGDSSNISNGDLSEIDLGNKGAITGLVVDDNYRPLQLREDWGNQEPGDFQDVGFVLVLETAQRFETTENGEFNVLPLEPGTYTIRVAADNHEAIDEVVTVVAGAFTEATVEARRTFSAGGTTLSQEEIIFIGCALMVRTPYNGSAGSASLPTGCSADTSQDSERSSYIQDYSGISDDIRGMVTEMRTRSEGYYSFALRTFEKSCRGYDTVNGCVFAETDAEPQGRYARNVIYPGLQLVNGDGFEAIEDGEEGYCTVNGLDEGSDEGCGRYFAPEFKNPFQTILFTDPPARYYEEQVGVIDPPGPLNPTTTGSAGVAFGIKAQFLQTVYLYELPEDGIKDFCALCDDADTPE